MSTNKNQTKLENFEDVRKVRKNGCLLIYDGDLSGPITVTNKTKGTVYTINSDKECSCEGYKYRSECKHLDGLNLLENQGDDL